MTLRDQLDGGGSFLKGPFVDAVRRLDRRFESAFEWCAGMGEIGLAILQADLADEICLADINPKAIEQSKEITQAMGLTNRVRHCVSDNFAAVPDALTFDLVVANPPNYFNVQASHPMGALLQDDLRPNDRGWKIHEQFYKSIGARLRDDAIMLIEEVEPYKTEVVFGGAPYDIRDEAPMATFERMTQANGLRITDCQPLFEMDGIVSYVLTIKADKRSGGEQKALS
jgi:predicted RNA methylase